MGISASKRVTTTLTNSPEFDSVCDAAYAHCISLTQHAFPGVFPYQLVTASEHIYNNLSTTQKHPLILKWVPCPPTRAQVDSAFRVISRRQGHDTEVNEELILGPAQFKEWAVVLFAEAIVGNAGKAVLARIPIGAAGIAGIGALTRSGKDLVGAAIGVYALGVATSIYLSLSG